MSNSLIVLEFKIDWNAVEWVITTNFTLNKGADPEKMFRGGGSHVRKNLGRQVMPHQVLIDKGYNVVAIYRILA